MAYAPTSSATSAGTATRPASNFCSSCGSAIDLDRDDRTIVFHPVDPSQDAPGPADDVVVNLAELPPGDGVLLVRSSPEAGKRLALERGAHRAGPAPRQRHLPRRHHRVAAPRRDRTRAPAGYVVRDVGSLNGTYVNHERIDETPLRHGDELQIGKFKLVFLSGPTRTDGAVNDRAYLSIGEVLGLLQDEFPDVTISKIRFLESQGLIDPERTPSGYRKFYDADIERLRFILREQREHFLPLKVIKDRLDSGEPLTDSEPTVAVPAVPSEAAVENIDPEEPVPSWLPKPPRPGPPAPPPARPAPTAGVAAPRPAGAGYTFDEIVAESGLNAAQLKEVEGYGLLAGRAVGRETYYDEDALGVAQLAAQFLQFGVEARHLRMYRTSAEREAGFVESVVMPLVKQRNPGLASRRSRPSRRCSSWATACGRPCSARAARLLELLTG